jgi:hypothetical protein
MGFSGTTVVLVNRDLAFGDVLGSEHALLDGLDTQRRPLGGSRIKQTAEYFRFVRILACARFGGQHDGTGCNSHENQNDCHLRAG